MQAEPEENAGEDEIVSVSSTQAADQVEKRRRGKERIERETQSDARDHVRPVGDPKKKKCKEADTLISQFFSKQINIRQRENAEQCRAKFET